MWTPPPPHLPNIVSFSHAYVFCCLAVLLQLGAHPNTQQTQPFWEIGRLNFDEGSVGDKDEGKWRGLMWFVAGHLLLTHCGCRLQVQVVSKSELS